jgi:glycosyltransferase involved in cell wall biosynthesis
MKRKRVLHVIQNLNYGGMERVLADIVRFVDREYVESHVLALEYLGRFAEGLGSFATLHVAPPLPRWSMLWPRSLIRQIARIAPDVVHTHSGVWYKASLAARKAGVPGVIHTEQGLQLRVPWHDRLVNRLAARRTDVVVAVSDALAQRLATIIAPADGQLRVVRNAVDVELFRPRPDTGAIRKELDLSAEVPIVGSIGRLEHIKGYDLMVLAFAELQAIDGVKPSPVLVLAGDGSERPRLEALAKKLRIARSVRFLGWRDDVHDLHSAFTLFTMSSRSEGTSLSLLEAMSAGLCPVVTDVGGNAAVLGEKLRHRLVPAENPGALAAAWRHALTVREQREADAMAARARVNDSFRLEAMVREYERLYSELPAR